MAFRVCVCVCVLPRLSNCLLDTHAHTNEYTYICMYTDTSFDSIAHLAFPFPPW